MFLNIALVALLLVISNSESLSTGTPYHFDAIVDSIPNHSKNRLWTELEGGREASDSANVLDMGNLIPEARTDKLGRTIIRHVRPEASASNTKAVLPAPSISKSRTADRPFTPEELDRTVKRLLKRTGIAGRTRTNFKGEGVAENTLRYVAERAPEELRKFDKEMRDADPWTLRNWAETLNRVDLTPPYNDREADMLPEFLQTKVIVEQTVALTTPVHTPSLSLRSAAMRTLRDKIDKDDHDTVRAAMLAVYIMPTEASDKYTELDYERDLPSIEYIKSHYDAVMENRATLRERGSIEPEAMDVIISSEVSALTEGIL